MGDKLLKLEDVLQNVDPDRTVMHGHTVRYRSMRGIAYSRIEGKEREGVGNSEFKVDDLCWPQGYTQYYLKDHKVLPTKRFYEKINALFDKFIPGEGSGTTDPQNGATDLQNGV